jgi:hypothetical protein
MDAISAVVFLAAVAAPIAVVSGWFVRTGFEGFGSVVNRGDKDTWWRSSMPWPHGVQEADGPRWQLGSLDRSQDPSADGPAANETTDDALRVAPVRALGRVAVRAGTRHELEQRR